MRTNQTTFQRAIAQARKLQPAVMKLNTYDIYIVDSTSELGIDYQVELGKNKFNPLIDAICDCKGLTNCCIHRAAAFLQYLSNLEARLWKGCDYITELQNNQEDSDEALKLWLDLLDRYERASDLLKAIEHGYDISTVSGPIKDRTTGLLLLTA